MLSGGTFFGAPSNLWSLVGHEAESPAWDLRMSATSPSHAPADLYDAGALPRPVQKTGHPLAIGFRPNPKCPSVSYDRNAYNPESQTSPVGLLLVKG